MPAMAKRTADQRRRALKQFMARNGLNVKRWCEDAGVSPQALYNFFRGSSHSLSPETYQKLSDSARVPVSVLTGEDAGVRVATRVEIRGEVKAGAWRESLEWDRDDWELTYIPVQPAYAEKCFGLLVSGTSMDRDYPDGSIAVCVNLYQFDRDIKSGDHVVCDRIGKDELYESTVKELVIDEAGQGWLWPRSKDPLHQRPIPMGEQGVDRVVIRAVVIGAYTPRRL